jgi:hypothetical protein
MECGVSLTRGQPLRVALGYGALSPTHQCWLADSVGVHAQPCRPLLRYVWSATNEIVRMIMQHANRRASLWYVLGTVY